MRNRQHLLSNQPARGIGSVILNDKVYEGLGNNVSLDYDRGAGAEFHVECGIGEVVVTTGW